MTQIVTSSEIFPTAVIDECIRIDNASNELLAARSDLAFMRKQWDLPFIQAMQEVEKFLYDEDVHAREPNISIWMEVARAARNNTDAWDSAMSCAVASKAICDDPDGQISRILAYGFIAGMKFAGRNALPSAK